MKIVEIRGLVVQLGGKAVLQNVDFAVGPGEIVTIIGPNGSGKSTLLRAIIGALAPTSGEVKRRQGLRIGYVPQRLHIDTNLPMTVRSFLNLPNRFSKPQVAHALEQAGVPDLSDRQMTRLSSGQFQRALLARALLRRPELLILDEATQGLDQSGEADFYRQVEEVRHQSGCAVLMVSHDLHVVMSASDRVVCLNGHVCCEGVPEHVASAPEYRALFGEGTKGTLALYKHHGHHRNASSNPSKATENA